MFLFISSTINFPKEGLRAELWSNQHNKYRNDQKFCLVVYTCLKYIYLQDSKSIFRGQKSIWYIKIGKVTFLNVCKQLNKTYFAGLTIAQLRFPPNSFTSKGPYLIVTAFCTHFGWPIGTISDFGSAALLVLFPDFFGFFFPFFPFSFGF